MGPASLQEETEQEPGGEMECYHSLLQAGSQLENTLQRKYLSCTAPSLAYGDITVLNIMVAYTGKYCAMLNILYEGVAPS